MRKLNEQEISDFDHVKNIVAQAAERFDSVQIFVVTKDGGAAHWGSGNFLTRYGQVREWIVYEDEITRERARGKNAWL